MAFDVSVSLFTFLIPRSTIAGNRARVMAPTRELAKYKGFTQTRSRWRKARQGSLKVGGTAYGGDG